MNSIGAPVLLLGYNRLEYIQKMLKEIISWNPPHIYISIDGPKTENDLLTSKMILNFLSKYEDIDKITVYSHEKNLGLAYNTTGAITKILKSEECLIILDDDIEIFYNAYLSISKILKDPAITGFAIVNGFSSIPAPPKFLSRIMPNKFRAATYTAVWGWGIRKAAWDLFELDISKVDRNLVLSKSKLWNNLSSRQKNIWLGRFKKVSDNPRKTWDFQMQFMCFKYDLPNLSPIFRAVDNIGFGDYRSTNTKNKKPKFYFGKTDYRQIEGVIWQGITPIITDFADAFSDLIPFLKKFIKFNFK